MYVPPDGGDPPIWIPGSGTGDVDADIDGGAAVDPGVWVALLSCSCNLTASWILSSSVAAKLVSDASMPACTDLDISSPRVLIEAAVTAGDVGDVIVVVLVSAVVLVKVVGAVSVVDVIFTQRLFHEQSQSLISVNHRWSPLMKIKVSHGGNT